MNLKQINKYIDTVDEIVYTTEAQTKNTMEKVVVHHTAMQGSLKQGEAVFNIHVKEKGWAGGGYNLLIEKDGSIFQFRAIGIDLAAHSGYNSKYLAICLAGNFENETPTPAQLETLDNVIDELSRVNKKRYRQTLLGHGDIGATLCPGSNFNITAIKNKEEQPEQDKLALIAKLRALISLLQDLLKIKMNQ